MLGLQIGKTKYDRQKEQAAKKGMFLEEHTLICVTDGCQVTHLDDGPADPSKPPNPGRQKLLAAITKRIMVNGQRVPVFYALKKGLEVMDNNAGRPVPVPFYDADAKALTAAFLEHRKAASMSGRAQWEGEKKRYQSKDGAA